MIPRVGPARGAQPGGAVDARELDGVPGARGKLLQILELRAAVALAERVNMVDVAQHRTRALGELIRLRLPEILSRDWNRLSPLAISTVRTSPAHS